VRATRCADPNISPFRRHITAQKASEVISEEREKPPLSLFQAFSKAQKMLEGSSNYMYQRNKTIIKIWKEII